MVGRIRAEPARRLLELPLVSGPISAACVMPGDGDVDEALEEVALGGLGGPPEVLQYLVGREVLAAVDQLEPPLELLGFRGRSCPRRAGRTTWAPDASRGLFRGFERC